MNSPKYLLILCVILHNILVVYPSGRIGLWAWDTKVSFDDAKIIGKGIPESSAVSLNGKLITKR